MFHTDLKKGCQYEYQRIKKKAVKRYKNGESPKEIYQSFGKGKT